MDKDTQELIRSALKFYQKQMNEIDKQISNIIAAGEELKQHNEILNSSPDVGPATAGILLAELSKQEELNRAWIASLAPIAKDS